MNAWEVNFDGLVGLTHHYAGLSFGNEASTRHRFQVSNPRLAAKQGLLKMKKLAGAGFPGRDPAARASVYSGAASVGIQW